MRLDEITLNKISDWMWEVPRTGGMRVPAHIYASEHLMESIMHDDSLVQAANVAHLPGIVKHSLAMPDMHLGYGFPIGGVAATDPENGGVISPGGIGYDINCGVRLIRTDLEQADVRGKLKDLTNQLFRDVPVGVGSSKAIERLSRSELEKVATEGSAWAVGRGLGIPDDLERTENSGCLEGADFSRVSDHAAKRGAEQVGTLGAGNHFLEIDVVENIFHPEAAEAFGLAQGAIVLQVHCGSRGFGHQICSDYLKVMQRAVEKYNISLPDRQLACAPLNSDEGRSYFAAMACAANFAWANRQTIMHNSIRAFQKVLGRTRDQLGMRLVYDVCHNIAKFEEHTIDGARHTLCVHRKGATRAFPEGHPQTPGPYRHVGQPVLIPGDMGRQSFVLVGAPASMQQTFGSTCHGAGRMMSRSAALRQTRNRNIARELEDKGIVIRAKGRKTLGEEFSEAYKDVGEVVNVMHNAGIALKVARLRPIAVIKG
ncbi:MAG: RtcB family protein [Planctomycetes bacterium]|nr:RtcB family protein [Planctomycetota bacterium]